MSWVPIRNLGQFGMNEDRPPWDLQINEFSRANNVRFSEGAVMKTPEPILVENLAESPVWAQIWIRQGIPTIAYASSDDLFVNTGSGFLNASRIASFGYSSSDTWQSFVWGESVVFNNGGDVPQILEPTETNFADLPNWPATLRAKVVRGYRAFMVALGVTENGLFDPNVVAWSTEAAPGEVPATWDPSDTTALAGRNPLDFSAGELLDCKPLGDVNIIYGQQATYSMQFIGGNDVFAFRRVFEEGIIARDAVAAFDRFHLVVGPTQIYIHDGNSMRYPAHNRVQKTFYSELGDRDTVRCLTNPKTKEVWIYYRTVDSDFAEKALVYNYQDDTWTFIDTPNITCAIFGPKQGEPFTWEDAQDSGVTWEEITERWSEAGAIDIYPVMYFFDASSNQMLEADFLFTGDATQRFFVEKIGIDLDQALGVPTKQWKYLKQIVPQIEGTGDIQITLGEHFSPTSPVNWQSPQTFNIGTDYKLDTRIKARYLAFRVESNSPGFFQLTGWDFDIIPVDMR